MPAAAVHITPYSGSWYPQEPEELRQLVDELWEASLQRTGSYLLPNARGYLVPHAGLAYSGTVAAAVYRHIESQQPRSVVLLGFAHKGAPSGLWIPEVSSIINPLGETHVDAEMAGRLVASGAFHSMAEERLCDHSIEIQLPLLQRAAPEARIVPVYVSGLSDARRDEAAGILAGTLGPNDVVVASSDLTHFGAAFGYEPFRVDSQTGERLRRLDFEVLDSASSLLPQMFMRTLRQTASTVCGYEPVSLLLAVMRMLDGEVFQSVLDYQASGEITEDFHHSVSYGAAGYFPASSFEVTPEAGTLLLDLARRTLGEYRRTGRRPKVVLPERPDPILDRRSAAFVTLWKQGDLRGCIGHPTNDSALGELIPELTMAAALDDSRFDRLAQDETGIDIDISLLTPLKRIPDRSCFKVNTHGAILRSGYHQGLLLPQVATERGWGADQFFAALAHKAGVSMDVYADPATELHVFRAQVIH